MIFLREKYDKVFFLILAVFMVTGFLYQEYTDIKNLQKSAEVTCDVVIVESKDTSLNSMMYLESFVLFHIYFVHLKLGEYEWTHEVGQNTYDNIQVGNWAKYCQSGEKQFPWLEDIIKK